METVKLSAQARVNLGKKESKALRAAGNVPCVIYGGEKSIHFSAQDKDLRNLVYTPNVYQVDIDVDGTSYTAILKDIQFHPVTDKVIHIDFMELVADKEITLNVPVRLEGSAKGVMNGGKLRKNMRQLTVRAIPANLPDSITIDVTELGIGNSTRVSDLEGNNFDILNPSSAVIVAVKMARGAAADEEEEGEAEKAGHSQQDHLPRRRESQTPRIQQRIPPNFYEKLEGIRIRGSHNPPGKRRNLPNPDPKTIQRLHQENQGPIQSRELKKQKEGKKSAIQQRAIFF